MWVNLFMVTNGTHIFSICVISLVYFLGDMFALFLTFPNIVLHFSLF